MPIKLHREVVKEISVSLVKKDGEEAAEQEVTDQPQSEAPQEETVAVSDPEEEKEE